MKLLVKGRTDLLWYAVLSRVRGLDLGVVPLEELGLNPQRSVLHGNSGGPDLEHVLREIGIPIGSRVVDLGSGKGGAILTLSAFPFSEIVGLELSANLIRIAEANLRRAGLRQVRFVETDAAEFTELDRFTHFYMYHPFPCVVVREVMENLAESLARAPRDLTLIYANPVCHAEVMAIGLFNLDREFQARDKFCVYVHKSYSPGSWRQIHNSESEPTVTS